MRNIRPDVYQILEMFEHLSIDEKRKTVKLLQKNLEAVEAEPEKSYLEDRWEEIQGWIYNLSFERYIDDQFELEEIWNSVEEMRKDSKLKDEAYETRFSIIEDIIENGFYNRYDLDEPMENLIGALIMTPEEGLKCAEMAESNGEMGRAADMYKLYGREDKYMLIKEKFLARKPELYLEQINYYADKNENKAIELAEKAKTKCYYGDLTDIYLYMLKFYIKKDESDKILKVIRSAKAKRNVNSQTVVDFLIKESDFRLLNGKIVKTGK